jgi:hypothetical protein
MLRQAIEDIKWCDEIWVCCNNIDDESRLLLKELDCNTVDDNREWGKHQWQIKEEFFKNYLRTRNPDWIVAKDADEIFDKHFNREEAERLAREGFAGYNFYVVNLVEGGYSAERSFWNCRFWRYSPDWPCEWQRRNLHCGLYPLHNHRHADFAPFILKHYGLLNKELRKKKSDRYDKYDPEMRWMRMNGEFYGWLKQDNIRVDKYDEDELHLKAVNFSQNTIKKRQNMFDKKQEKVHYFRRAIDGELIPVMESMVEETKSRMRNGQREFEYVGEVNNYSPQERREEAPVVVVEPEEIKTNASGKKRGRKPAGVATGE